MKKFLAALLFAGIACADTFEHQMTEYTHASVLINEYGVGMLSVAGTLVPDITSLVFVDTETEENDKPVYAAGDWVIWWDGTNKWIISDEIDSLDPAWEREDASVIGAFAVVTNVTGTATTASAGEIRIQNEARYPWQIGSFEVVQHEDVSTNNITVTVFRAFDYQEQIIGAVTTTNVFGVVETRIDTTPTGQTWRQSENKVFSVAQTADEATYSPNTTTVFPSNVYISGDDVIVIGYDALEGTYFRINGIK